MCIGEKASKLRLFFKLVRGHLAPFLCSFNVGNTDRNCVGNDLTDGQDDLRDQRRFTYSIQVVLGIPKKLVLSGSGAIFASKDRCCRHGQSWQVIKKLSQTATLVDVESHSL